MRDRAQILKSIEDCGLIVVVRAESARQAMEIAQAVAQGGISAVEITMTVPDAVSVLKEARKILPQDILLGAGTVLDGKTAQACITAGAEFIVSPVLNLDVVKACRKSGKVVIPGAFTPTEIMAVVRSGADIVKLFPASIGGPELVKDLRGPFPALKLLPTGGVNLENAGQFIRAGAFAVAVGGNIVDKKAVAEGNYAVVTQNARKFVAAVKSARSS